MLYAIVMAGGSGTRFWPKSRRHRPKQLLPLYGTQTMLQQTVSRIEPLVPPQRTFVITGADQAEAIREQLPGLPAEHVVAEPCPRDTAPCVGLAAAILDRLDPQATMIVMPADHVIEPQEQFLRTVRAAVSVIDAEPSAFVTFGITPTRPETGYGYIERGERLGVPEGIGLYRVAQFREKPDKATAEQVLAAGTFAWNSGIFVWRARAILDALKQHRPNLAAAIERVAKSLGTPAEAETIAREYPQMERIPIDKAVMEKALNVRVLEVSYTWNDVGDWRALTSLISPDAQGNTLQCP
ncbi:MAG TPA: mannose-1-phosphate guanylyltransferase, partial [Isosphaeraceae bacterium]|nr:mannose-1-phosphate guanylyltransferase [Isosphaeraceae bacterium]